MNVTFPHDGAALVVDYFRKKNLFPNLRTHDIATMYEVVLASLFKDSQVQMQHFPRAYYGMENTCFMTYDDSSWYITYGREKIKRTHKTCRPMVRVQFKDGKPEISLVAKITTRIVPGGTHLALITREMDFREAFKNDKIAPQIIFQGYYNDKFLQIEELCWRSLDWSDFGLPTDPEELAKIFFQFVQAVAKIQQRGMIHGDIKPENCLLNADNSEYQGFLCDFGHMRKRSERYEGCGTLLYGAPEQLELFDYPSDMEITPKIDVWGLGWVLSYLMGIRGYEWHNKLQAYLKKAGTFEEYMDELTHFMNREQPCIDTNFLGWLLWKCWQIDPNDRIDVVDLELILQEHFEN